MSFSIHGIWISLLLIVLCGAFFFYNQKSKFFVPKSYLISRYRYVYTVFLGLFLVCIVLLPLRLAFVYDRYVVDVKDVPIQIILDVSLSMASTDLKPSRFVAAKDALISLIQHLDGYYLSLIVFSGKPFVYIPFSSYTDAIIDKLQTMNLGDFPPVQEFLGTAIGDALLLGVGNLVKIAEQGTYKPGIVILITDGDSNLGFDPIQVLSYYQKIQVPLFVVGVGQENYLIGRDSWNDSVMTDINLPLLQELARRTGGKFYRVLGEESFDQFFTELSQDVINRQYQQIRKVFLEITPYLVYFIVCMLLMLLVFRLYLLFSSTKRS